MPKYCRSYFIRDLRQFNGWDEQFVERNKDLSDDTIVYLWDDFTVVKSPVLPDEDVLWSNITPEWQQFCQQSLRFEIPEDLRYAYKQTDPSISTTE